MALRDHQFDTFDDDEVGWKHGSIVSQKHPLGCGSGSEKDDNTVRLTALLKAPPITSDAAASARHRKATTHQFGFAPLSTSGSIRTISSE